MALCKKKYDLFPLTSSQRHNAYKKVTLVIKKCVLVRTFRASIMKNAESKSALTTFKEDITMALSDLYGWGKKDEEHQAPVAACGAADEPAEAPTACGAAEAPAACGAADKPEETPAACGTACGAGDK